MKLVNIYLISHISDQTLRFIGATELSLNKEWKKHLDAADSQSNVYLNSVLSRLGVSQFRIRLLDEVNSAVAEEKYNDLKAKNFAYDVTYEKYNGSGNITPWKPEEKGDGKHFGLKVEGTNIKTGESKVWQTAREAAHEITGNSGRYTNILKVAKGIGKTYYGYTWKIIEDKKKVREIYSTYKGGSFAKKYSSMREAVRDVRNLSVDDFCDTGRLSKALASGGTIPWAGYYWFYYD